MRIVVDATAGARPERSGIGRYVHGLLEALALERELPSLELGVRGAKWGERGRLPLAAFAAPPPLRKLADWRDRFGLRGVDLVHGLDVRLPPNRRVARVATLHDTFSLDRDDLADPSFRAMRAAQYRELADRAQRVVCVSAATEARFLDHFPQARGRTCVVHHGVDARFARPAEREVEAFRARRGLPPRFLLFVGLLSTRKNLLLLLEAFRALAERQADVALVLAGAESHGFDAIASALSVHPFRHRIVRPGFLPDAELPHLYAAASCFAFPSLLEGFGLPLLESLACGTPAVASELPVVREIGGGEIATAPGDAAEPLAAALLRELADPPDALRRARLVAHARGFTWAKAARATIAAWHAALEQPR